MPILILVTHYFYALVLFIFFLPFQTTGSEKRTGKTGSGRPSRQGQLRHTGSLTYGKDSQAAREHFLSSIRGGKRDEGQSLNSGERDTS